MTRYYYESKDHYDDIDNVFWNIPNLTAKLERKKYLNQEDADKLIEALQIIRKLRANKD